MTRRAVTTEGGREGNHRADGGAEGRDKVVADGDERRAHEDDGGLDLGVAADGHAVGDGGAEAVGLEECRFLPPPVEGGVGEEPALLEVAVEAVEVGVGHQPRDEPELA